MKKKLLFLMSVLLLSAIGLSSCSKDAADEPQAATTVANTAWKAADGTILKFYSNGTFEFTWKWSDSGEYKQLGNEINMVGQTVWYNDHLYNLRYAHVNGSTMNVEMFRALVENSLINVTFRKQ